MKGRVLIVEDELELAELIQIYLSKDGIDSEICSTGESGIVRLSEVKFDLVVLDINLPDMSGLEALAHLHKSPETKDIPVIALSANAMPGQVQKGLEGGFRYYLTKPINIREAVEALTVVSGE